MSKGKVLTPVTRTEFIFFLGTPGEELSKEEKNLAIMAMKKKDKRLYDRIMHSKKKKRSEVNYFSVFFSSFKTISRYPIYCAHRKITFTPA